MRNPQINAIVAIEKGYTCEKLLEVLCYSWNNEDIEILKSSIKNLGVKRQLKKEIEESIRLYKSTHFILDLWFRPTFRSDPQNPASDFDLFWTNVFFEDADDFDAFCEYEGWKSWEIYSSLLIILYMSPPKW